MFGYLCLLEVKNRSLEEIDSLFNSGIRMRDFKNHQLPATDLRKELTELETMSAVEVKDYEKDAHFVAER